ncbi:MAG: DNA repair protein RadA [Myxococcota bacterium]
MAKAKSKTRFVCQACGAEAARWMGKCPSCGTWNSLVEERAPKTERQRATGGRRPVALGEVDAETVARLPTGIGEFDRALGGGFVPGGVTLLGGDPGIGKSTLLMQVLGAFAGRGGRVLYVTGEESAAQVALRGRRLAKAEGHTEGIEKVALLATTELEDALLALRSADYQVAVIDSIQTLRDAKLESAPGTVSQLREVSTQLIDLAKGRGVALSLIGHVTKDGALAGPKVLEHLVDTVLSFEGDRSGAFRMVRATKNRFGPAHELGVFEMVEDGLREVPDPSALFLAERRKEAAGSVVVPTAEGSRPLLVELQALVAPAVYGAARRVASGVDGNRLAILLAVLDRKAEVHVLDRDVFASVAGGARVGERATDLALALAVVSSLRGRALPEDVAAFGEVGLSGEVRAVPRASLRVAEARKLGYRRVVLPKGNADRMSAAEQKGSRLIAVATLDQAIEATFD